MATVKSWDIVQRIIQYDGLYPGDDLRVVRIVQYNNVFDGAIAYGLIYKSEDLHRYHDGATRNPQTIWEYDPNPSEKI